jgi:ABC-type branched-subunit amino acid transport system ATPase component
MLALASAIITGPPLLVLDEPTTGLSPAIVHDLIQHIVGLRREGTAVLWVVEGNPLEILRHADRTYIMRGGLIEREVFPTDLLNDESLRDFFFGVEPETGDLSHTGTTAQESDGG